MLHGRGSSGVPTGCPPGLPIELARTHSRRPTCTARSASPVAEFRRECFEACNIPHLDQVYLTVFKFSYQQMYLSLLSLSLSLSACMLPHRILYAKIMHDHASPTALYLPAGWCFSNPCRAGWSSVSWMPACSLRDFDMLHAFGLPSSVVSIRTRF
jgi:hypothetical protein